MGQTELTIQYTPAVRAIKTSILQGQYEAALPDMKKMLEFINEKKNK